MSNPLSSIVSSMTFNEFASPIEIGDPGRTSFNMTIWMVGLELSTTNRTLGKGLVSSCANPGRSSSCKRKSSRPEFTAGTRMSRLNSPFSRGEVLHTWSKSPKTTSNEPGGAGVSSSLNRTRPVTRSACPLPMSVSSASSL